MHERWFQVHLFFYDAQGEECDYNQSTRFEFVVMDQHWMRMFSSAHLEEVVQKAESLNMEMMDALEHLGEPEPPVEGLKSKGFRWNKKGPVFNTTVTSFGGGGVGNVGGGT